MEPRVRATLRARLRDSQGEREVRLLDLSSRGVLATCELPPLRGEFVELVIGRHSLIGQVKWSGATRFGLVLRERVSVSALIAGEQGSIALASSAAARQRSGGLIDALAGERRSLGQMLQFGIVLAALGAAAWLASDYVGKGMGSLGEAKQAMAGEVPVKR
ncbi:MAG: PilZ domain-containing protein [Novosphingobium sp.]|nr:PilZ domain-containing protein [Novosphingobium sp.]